MCSIIESGMTLEEIKNEFELKIDKFNAKWDGQERIYPGQKAPVIISGSNILDVYQFGLVPYWAKDPKIYRNMFNARCETITEKPSFRELIKRNRCLVLVSGFYEFDKTKTRHLYKHKKKKIYALAGIYDNWVSGNEKIDSFSIITTEANELIGKSHHRMPVIIDEKNYETWLRSEEIAEVLGLLRPFGDEVISDERIEKK
jgi:putative SOS response-associated peptidase YedK